MSRGRPVKKGLDWFKKDVDFYEDFKIIDLMDEYGPLGVAVFDCILCMIYREGYYLEIDPANLASKVVRVIGNKWVKDKHLALQVIHYCAELGLFDKPLVRQNVFTSAGIQRRYAEVTSRSKCNKSLYWLVDENGQPLITTPSDQFFAAENGLNATENAFFAANTPQEKEKEKEEEKEREKNGAPTLSDIVLFFKEKNLNGNPEAFFQYYEARSWKVNGSPIENWRAAARSWSLREKGKVSSSVRKPTYELDEFEALMEESK